MGEKTYASLSSRTAGNILTSSKNRPLNIATKIGCALQEKHPSLYIIPYDDWISQPNASDEGFSCGLNYLAFSEQYIYSIGTFTVA